MDPRLSGFTHDYRLLIAVTRPHLVLALETETEREMEMEMEMETFLSSVLQQLDRLCVEGSTRHTVFAKTKR